MDATNIIGALGKERENTIKAIEKAHVKVASEAERMLKKGLSYRAGRDSSSPDYRNSPKGSLPYMHTGRLRNSIGYKVTVKGNKVISEVGSGTRGLGVEYAKYLQGYNNDGLRPFLDYIEGVYNAQTIDEAFLGYFRPLEGK
jgi:hypothetical protein